MRGTRLVARCSALAAAFVVLLAAPASAHGTAQVPATDYVTTTRGIVPTPPAGVSVRAVDDGSLLELRNTSGRTVTVEGYDGEPYLRIGRDGVFRNRRSPAVFWNRQINTEVALPKGYDAKAAPDWRKLSSGTVARWHDHRAHFMGSADGGSQIVLRFKVPIEIDGARPANIVGDVRYLPPPSPWPYVGAALLLAVALVLAGRTRQWPRVLLATVTVLVVTAGIEVAGEWNANTLSFASRIGEHVYVFAGLVLGLAAIVHLVARRDRAFDATPLALLAGVALLLASGLSSLPLLAHSVLPTKLPEGAVRVLVTLTIATGAAAIVISATHLRRPFERRPGGDDQESSATSAILRSMYAEK